MRSESYPGSCGRIRASPAGEIVFAQRERERAVDALLQRIDVPRLAERRRLLLAGEQLLAERGERRRQQHVGVGQLLAPSGLSV